MCRGATEVRLTKRTSNMSHRRGLRRRDSQHAAVPRPVRGLPYGHIRRPPSSRPVVVVSTSTVSRSPSKPAKARRCNTVCVTLWVWEH